MGAVVVHRGSPEAVFSVAHYLQEHGLDAQVIDRPNFVVLMVSFGTYKSRVVVPEEQAQAAREALERWDEDSREALQVLTRELGRYVLYATLIALASALYLGWNLDEDRIFSQALLLPVVWVGSFVVISILSALRKR